MSAPPHKLQYAILAGLSVVAGLLTTVVVVADPSAFARFIGSTNPLLAAAIITVAGFLAFALLLRRDLLRVYAGAGRGVAIAAGVAVVLGAAMVLADTQIRFPLGINITFPVSVAFYPAIAFYVEILWHVVPLTVLFLSARALIPQAADARIVVLLIPIIALVDPAYQVQGMMSTGGYATWAIAFVGVHVFVHNAAQLWLFTRFDFVAMLSLRLVYYLIWHVVWGASRADLLF